jgi:hypothetical protein
MPEGHATRGYVRKLVYGCSSFLVVAGVATLLMSRGASKEKQEELAAETARKAAVLYEAEEGKSDSIRALIRCVTPKRFEEEYR